MVASTARGLGVRVPEDICPDEGSAVSQGIGGMSVSPDSIWNLPAHRRPRTMGRGSTGHACDAVYETTLRALIPYTLSVRRDPDSPTTHAFVEPALRRPLADYQKSIGDSRPMWKKVEP